MSAVENHDPNFNPVEFKNIHDLYRYLFENHNEESIPTDLHIVTNLGENYSTCDKFLNHILVCDVKKNRTKFYQKYLETATSLVELLHCKSPSETLEEITRYIISKIKHYVNQMTLEDQRILKLSLDERVYTLAPKKSKHQDSDSKSDVENNKRQRTEIASTINFAEVFTGEINCLV